MDKDKLLEEYRRLDKETDGTLKVKDGKLDMTEDEIFEYRVKTNRMEIIANRLYADFGITVEPGFTNG